MSQSSIRTFPVSGRLMGGTPHEMRPVGGLRVDIWMAPLGKHGEDAELVGHTVTAADGSFHAQVGLPDNLPLQEYEVFASTPGDRQYAESVSD